MERRRRQRHVRGGQRIERTCQDAYARAQASRGRPKEACPWRRDRIQVRQSRGYLPRPLQREGIAAPAHDAAAGWSPTAIAGPQAAPAPRAPGWAALVTTPAS
jgi:hypothetical protein